MPYQACVDWDFGTKPCLETFWNWFLYQHGLGCTNAHPPHLPGNVKNITKKQATNEFELYMTGIANQFR